MASARYITPSGPQAEYEPGSHGRVLRNRLGIRRAGEMAEAEYAALLETRLKYMNRVAADTRFTAPLVCQMHRDWLGGIYEWAGCYRSVEIQKGDFRWPPAYLVARNMQRFEEGALRRSTPCRSGSISHVAQQVAEVHSELLLIHPFREGNGRLARWLADVMVLQAGLRIPHYGFRGRGSRMRRQRYLEAVRQGYLGEYDFLTAFFAEAIEQAVALR